MEGFKRFPCSRKRCESRHLYLCTSHIVPSNLIILEKNECSGTIATIEQGEQIATIDFDTTLWHKRLGHMSEKDMKVLHSKQVLLGLKCVNMNFLKVVCMENKREWVL